MQNVGDKLKLGRHRLVQPAEHVADVAQRVVCVHFDRSRHTAGTAGGERSRKRLTERGAARATDVLERVAVEHDALAQRVERQRQQRVELGRIVGERRVALGLDPAIEAAVGGLLVHRHRVHDLETGALMLRAQEQLALRVNATNASQSGKERHTQLAGLESGELGVGELKTLEKVRSHLALSLCTSTLTSQCVCLRNESARDAFCMLQPSVESGARLSHASDLRLNTLQLCLNITKESQQSLIHDDIACFECTSQLHSLRACITHRQHIDTTTTTTNRSRCRFVHQY
jgi:hypothetical protein